MMILASDFDDTIFLNDDISKTRENVKYIKKYISNGNIFCIITGRNYTDIKPILTDYDIAYDYLICEDGAKIFNGDDVCLDTVFLDKEEIENIVSTLEKENCDYYLDDGYNETDDYNNCVKVVVNVTDELFKNKIVDLIKKSLDIHVYASRTHVNIIHKTVNKENALRRLFNLEKLDYAKLHVIGDNDNDYEMIKAFNGAVIAKHHEKLNQLKKNEYESLSDYIKELIKN